MTSVASNIAKTLVLLGVATCVLAQDAGSGKSTGQSRLHITVQVEPMVITPAPASKPPERNAVVYHLPIKREHMSVTEELHVVWLMGTLGRPERCWLKTITVVPE